MWQVAKSERCGSRKPWAVVDDQSGQVDSCHATEREAQRRKSDLVDGRRRVKAHIDTVDMWPDYDELDRTTTELEWALERCYLAALANWMEAVTPLVIPADENLPVDLEALVGGQSMAIWRWQFRLLVRPAIGLIWAYAYAQAQWALGIPLETPPVITASGDPSVERDEEELRKLIEKLKKRGDVIYDPGPNAPKHEFPPLGNDEPPWLTSHESPMPEDVGIIAPVQGPMEPDIQAQKARHRAAEAADRAAGRVPDPAKGPTNVSWSENFPLWLDHMENLSGLFENTPPDPRSWDRPFPANVIRRREPSPPTPGKNILTRSTTSRSWVEENWPADVPFSSRQVRQNDLVGSLVALAWDSNPQQVRQAALLVWDQVSSKRRLEMFLGCYDPPVSESIPARVRDLLVGSTNSYSRRAIPIGEFKQVMGMFLENAVDGWGGTPSRDSKHIKGGILGADRYRKRGDYEHFIEGTFTEGVTQQGAELMEQDWEPGPLRRTAAELWNEQFRDVARSWGWETAGIINDAMLSAASQSGQDFDKVWVAHMDTRTRPSHYAADGQRVAMDATFTVGGHQLEYPGDPSAPAAEKRNCRCRVGMARLDKPLPKEQKRNPAQRNEIIHRSRQGYIRAREDPNGIGYYPPDAVAAVTAAATEQENTMSDFRTFSNAVIAFVGAPTSDGRMLARGIELTVRTPPLPLMWMKQSVEGHDAAFTVGVIESAEMNDAGEVVASGYLLNSPEADEAADQLAHGVTRPSVDLASVEWIITDADGNEVTEDNYAEGMAVFMTVTKAELIGTTLVATPAFGDTSLPLNIDRESRDVALVAAAAEDFRPRVYDHTLFENPNLDGPTLPTMDAESGRIYGHLACFGECHRSIQTECVMAPRSRANYAHFHTSPAVRLDDGRFLPVGRLTVGTGHAGARLGGPAAAAHYDNTGTCFALVRVGEDAHGIWFSGVAAPWATEDQIEMGLSSPLSGDWRDFGQGLELVAALAVNTPGFSVAKGRSDEQGRPVALVASLGPVPDERIESLSASYTLVKDAVKEALAETQAEDEQRRLASEREALLSRANTVTRPPTPDEEIAELLARRK